ncbi:neuron navigator 2 [Anoplopoma fimbria]|uniref:neuron navigator 2 n=1 Tax=Anoplopoma fimbria TaxID=229290 RepID=UPI0023EB1319|nr:neuron navigator 2 [Anoplopoma fimbria]
MPAILVASKMKSGLPKPKPVHSALPIPQTHSRLSALSLPSAPLKTHIPSLGQQVGSGPPRGVTPGAQDGEDSQIYTDWANHYLAKSGHKRLIKDLQTDVADGVLLAEIIQVVANEKIGDINGCPKSRTQMIENIDACLSFLAAKGVNIQGLSSEEIRNGNLKAILGLFFSLSRYKQQQQHAQRQNSQPSFPPGAQPQGTHPPLSQQSSAPAQLGLSTHGTPALTAQKAAQAEMQSRDGSQSKLLKFSLGQKKTSRLPGPSARVSTAGSDIPPRGSVGAAGNRRSQGFSDKTKANSHLNKDSSEGMTSQPSVMTEHAPSSAVTVSSSTSISAATSAQIPPPSSSSSSSSSSTAIPQPNSSSSSSSGSSSKSWRSKSMSSKNISPSPSSTSSPASAMQPVKQEKDASSKAEAPPKAVPQRSMLEKLKLFNSKGSSKSSSSSNGAAPQTDNGATAKQLGAVQVERAEIGSNTEPLEEDDGNARPGMNGTSNGTAYGAAPSAGTTVSTTASSPKIALRGIAQRTFSRALTAKKGSIKSTEKDKDKGKDKGKEVGKRISVPDRTELRGEELKEEVAPVAVDTDSSNKRTSKITSFIPKGGKVAKKESSTPAHSGIPKPGGKAPGVGGKASSVKEAGERPRSMRLGGGLAMHRGPLDRDRDSRHSSSTSSLASTEGKTSASPVAGGGTTQSTASNTISVQLPQTQQHHSHPNTATVAPFMYRSQTDGEEIGNSETGSAGRGGDVSFTKTSQLSIEDLSGEDPETRRLRTVKNIADLRQNLEETMSSLRGTQVTHSTLETTFDGSVTTDVSGGGGGSAAGSNNSSGASRSILSLTSSRPSLSSWRLGQSSPRLQAGDAPSMGNSYGGRAVGGQAGRYQYPGHLRRQLAGRGGAICSLDLADRAGEDIDLDNIAVDVTGYMSDGDVLSKNAARTDDVASGYMTDGGLGLYTRRLNRLPDSMAAVRETLHRNTSSGQGDADSWDDSSSVSSGISDNIDTDDINTSSSISSYANTPAAQRKSLKAQPVTDAEKHSASTVVHQAWSADEVKRPDGGSDSGVRMESASKWSRRNPSDISDESDKGGSGRKTPSVSHTGSWRRGMSTQVGVTSPRTKSTSSTGSTSSGGLKTHSSGKTDDVKVSEKGRLSPRPNGLHRSPSDAGRSSGDETKKQSIPSSRTSTTNVLTHTVSDPHSQTHTHASHTSRTPTSTFGFKKQGHGMVTMVTASGATITSGSATLGKMPKSGARSLAGGLKAGGQDGASMLGHHDDGFLPMSARSTLQYRSLPRPSRSGAAARHGNRSSTSSIEAAVLSVTTHGKNPMGLTKANGPGGLMANQTDREKGVSEIDNLRSGGVMQSGGAATVPLTGRQQVSSPTLRRLFGGKPGKQAPVTTAENMKNSTVISNPHATMNHVGTVLESPDGGLGGVDSETSSPLFGGRVQGLGMGTLGSEQASSPGSVYSSTGPSNSLTWGTTFSGSSAQSRESTLGGHGGAGSMGYPSVSSMHTSSESIDMSISSAGHGAHREDTLSALGRTGSTKTGMSESPLSSPSASPIFSRNTLPRKQDSGPHCGRNTLPKKGLRYGPSPHLRNQEEARDWLRSHSTSGLQESVSNSPFSPSSSITSPSGTRFNFGQLASSPTSAAQINLTGLRNNSLTNQEVSYDPSSDNRLRNSCMSLDEKTRTMSRSGSFRDGFEEVHGSSLSLVSSTSSIYSTNEEKSQSEIRKLRRELDASQEKVSALTTQLSANAHLVAAFEQSLGNMTIRLKSLTLTAEQKDSELNELRKTIELLKKQNAFAQAAINGVINTPELTPKGERTAGSNGSPQQQQQQQQQNQQPDLRIRRQHSSDSVSSVASATSHSSVGSNMDTDAKNKKKNKKNWLRSSFKQAFSKKKSPKSASSHSDIEEMTDSSLPSSPKLPHNGTSANSHMLRNTHSNSLLSECLDSEAETVMQLRSELREKEMKLTDIRLEALSSAHQLDQLREAMNRMQGEIEKLKSENDRLKVENHGSRMGSQASISSSPPRHKHSQAQGTGPGLSQQSLNLTTSESTSLDMLLDDTCGDGGMRKEGRHVKMVVSLDPDSKWGEESRPRHFLIGCIGVSGKTKWDVLDGVVRRLFKEYITHVDPVSQLGLSSDSVEGYNIGEILRPSIAKAAHTPELLPCGYLVGDSNTINIRLKGVSSENVDSLVFDTLIPKPMLQRYVSLLKEHRRVILSGPSGTGKTYLANQLSRHLLLLEGRPLTPHAVVTFNVDHKSSKELRQYLSGLAEQCSSVSGADSPLVVILDNLHHVSSLGEIFNGVFNCNFQHCPYIIGTMSQATSSAPNLQLHHNFRWVLCANHMEPVKGFLGRHLRRKLIETEIGSRTRNMELVRIIDWIPRVWHHLNRFLETHSSSDVTIGPRLFLSCPMDVEGSRVWFTDLWNYSIIPYMLEAVREGLQLYGRRAAWEDPAAWVIDTYPWSASSTPADWPPLLQLRPEDVGFDGYSAPREGVRKEPPQSDSDADPLMNMLMRLKEAATSSSPQSYDSDSNSNSHHDDILDTSLESTL